MNKWKFGSKKCSLYAPKTIRHPIHADRSIPEIYQDAMFCSSVTGIGTIWKVIPVVRNLQFIYRTGARIRGLPICAMILLRFFSRDRVSVSPWSLSNVFSSVAGNSMYMHQRWPNPRSRDTLTTVGKQCVQIGWIHVASGPVRFQDDGKRVVQVIRAQIRVCSPCFSVSCKVSHRADQVAVFGELTNSSGHVGLR